MLDRPVLLASFKFSSELLELDENGVNGFYWPVSPFETRVVREAVVDGLTALLRTRLNANEKDDARLVLILLFHVVIDVLSVYQNFAAIRRAQSEGRSIDVPETGRLRPAFVKGARPAFPRFVKELRVGPYRPRWYRLPLRMIRAALLRESVRRFPLLGVNWRKDIVVMTLGDLIDGHARAIHERVIYRGPHTWFRPVSGEVEAVDATLLNDLIAVIDKAYAAGGERLTEELVQYFSGWIGEAAAVVRVHLQRLEGRQRRLPSRLWTGSGAQIWSRILRYEIHRRGGDVCGHDHGIGAGHVRDRHKTLRDLEHCTSFVTFSAGQALAVRDNADTTQLIGQKLPQISCVPLPPNSPEWRVWQRRRSRQAPPAERKSLKLTYASVFPDGELVHLMPAHPEAILLDWMPRLMSQIAGRYNVTWKPHPAWRNARLDKLAAKLAIGKVEGPFENAIKDCDVLLMDWTQTSAISIAVCSDRPLVIIDFGLEKLTDHARRLLEKRAAIVDGSFDENNRAVIDWNTLHAAIDRSFELADDEFAKTFFLAA